ncbi:MAG TPA: GspH/FimT family pseudopilin [Burkholderiaceae bacterium]|nr:GspH/FimT family pseudopilin [Burkholderiaceae bacterium]
MTRLRGPGLPVHARGFTLVELIMVVLLLGILSFFAGSHLSDRNQANARGFAEQVASTLRFAQKAAIAQRRNIYVNIDTTARRVRACLDASTSCASPLASPGGGSLDITGASGLTLTSGATQFSFDALGRPSFTSNLVLTSSANGSTFTVTVQTESGYVQRS